METEDTNTQSYRNEIDVFECLAKFREPLLYSIIESLNLPRPSNGLDAGCGIGSITRMLSNAIGEKGSIIGLDLSKELIHFANAKNRIANIRFIEGDINALPFDDNSFDWIWSIDTVWPGPKKYGCPTDNPINIINEFYRVLRPGGSLFLLYWSSQKLLPGYPILEANLNTTTSATAPFIKDMNPKNHIMNAESWLQTAHFKNISIKTFAGDIVSPLCENDICALNILFNMLWNNSNAEVGNDDWDNFINLINSNSGKYILKNKNYYGFYTYTLFQGKK